MVTNNPKKQRICVLGLGAVGLPMACLIAKTGYQVHGVDIDSNYIENIENANVFKTEPHLLTLFNQVMSNKQLTISCEVTCADIYIIAVPTPLHQSRADTSYLEYAIEMITPYLHAESLVIIESTCPIGTTNNIAKQFEEQNIKPHLVYCPERMLPGNCLDELQNVTRILGGISTQATKKAADFYRTFINANLLEIDASTAEMIKLAENTFRDINIAYANELSVIADEHNIDIKTVIDFANQHPRVNIHKPGVGVGGHCLAVDPHFLVDSSPTNSQLILTARKVNKYKTMWIVEKIKAIAREHDIKVIACLGLTYKANIADTRNAPATEILKKLQDCFDTLSYDPYIHTYDRLDKINKHAEMIVILVAHTQFNNIIKQLNKNVMIVDMTGEVL